MRPLPRVLIVDESPESRDVLRTLLERRGAETIQSARPDEAVQLASLHRPDLIILDAESDHSDRCAASSELEAAASQFGTPIVILGTLSHSRGQIAVGQFVAKPYHYAPLIRKIENLLAAA